MMSHYEWIIHRTQMDTTDTNGLHHDSHTFLQSNLSGSSAFVNSFIFSTMSKNAGESFATSASAKQKPVHCAAMILRNINDTMPTWRRSSRAVCCVCTIDSHFNTEGFAGRLLSVKLGHQPRIVLFQLKQMNPSMMSSDLVVRCWRSSLGSCPPAVSGLC